MCAECVEYARKANEELDEKYAPKEQEEPEAPKEEEE